MFLKTIFATAVPFVYLLFAVPFTNATPIAVPRNCKVVGVSSNSFFQPAAGGPPTDNCVEFQSWGEEQSGQNGQDGQDGQAGNSIASY